MGFGSQDHEPGRRHRRSVLELAGRKSIPDSAGRQECAVCILWRFSDNARRLPSADDVE